MDNIQPIDIKFESLFAQISPEVLKTFDNQQIQAIIQAFSSGGRLHHLLQVKFPIPGIHFDLVFVIGIEDIPQKRSRAKEKLNPFWALGNILLFIGFLTILLTSYLGIFSFFVSDNKTTPNANSSYSTSIPWIFDKSECEHTGRTWRGQKCWDSEHSPNF